MDWKLKSKIQNAVSLLPSGISYATYYLLQRRFGALKRPNPMHRLASAIEAFRFLKNIGFDSINKVFFEIGTGRAPIAPIAYWLMGAKSTITVDVNRYLKADIAKDSLGFISVHEERVRTMFGSLIEKKRFDKLLRFYRHDQFSLSKLLDTCCISYIAPGDASSTGLASQSIDVHTSFRVLEHIPPDVLSRIFKEGNRIVKDYGFFVHRVDYSDHFSHSDHSISKINFLQFTDREWAKYAGNRYMYMNRLRHDDYLRLFEEAGHRLLAAEPDIDPQSLALLYDGQLHVDSRFASKSAEILATTGAWIVTTKRQ